MLPEYKIFCENVKLLRLSHNLTTKEMAEIAEISEWTLKRIEKCDPPKSLSVRILICLSLHFNINPASFLQREWAKIKLTCI